MRLKTGIALAVLMAGAGLLPAAAAHAATASETTSVTASDWSPVGIYDSSADCEDAGIKGQNKRWWVDYYCYRRTGSSFVLNVRYHW
jgi:hypothetical protein